MAVLRRIQATDKTEMKLIDYIFGTNDYIDANTIKESVIKQICNAMEVYLGFAPITITGDMTSDAFKALLLGLPCPCTTCAKCVITLEADSVDTLWIKGDGTLSYM